MTTRHRETPFGVLVDGDSDPAVIRVGGELDSNSAEKLRAAMTGVVGRQQTIVDIREVSFVDSAGLGALVGGIRRLREAGGSVVLCCTRASVLRLLRMTGLDRIVAVTGSLGEARKVVAEALLSA